MNTPALAQRFCLLGLIGLAAAQIASCDSDSGSSSTQVGDGGPGAVADGDGSVGSGGGSMPGDGGGSGSDSGVSVDPTGDGGLNPNVIDGPVGTGAASGEGGVSGGGGAGSGSASGSAGAAGTGNTSGAAGATGTGNTSGAAGAGGSFQCVPGGSQCTDCVDNDADGRIDAVDPECTGPLDNDEKTFATGIPGDNQDDLKSCHQDCFFDGNSGAGGGDCQNNLKCDPLRTAGACTFDSGARCPTEADQQGSSCVNVCKKLTPNGCDCFGCCQVPGVATGVRLSDTCSAADVNDPTKCTRCTLSTTCQNTCGECELCFGKTSLPASCYPPPVGGMSGGTGGASGSGGTSGEGGASGTGGTTGSGGTTGTGTGGTSGTGGTGGTYVPPPSCPGGVIPCGPGGVSPEQCPASTYCITGCCISFVN